jgi:hypothetical protein
LTSYNSATGRSSGYVVNQVEDLYNGLGQLTSEYQEHGGTVNTSTSKEVQYACSCKGDIHHFDFRPPVA